MNGSPLRNFARLVLPDPSGPSTATVPTCKVALRLTGASGYALVAMGLTMMLSTGGGGGGGGGEGAEENEEGGSG